MSEIPSKENSLKKRFESMLKTEDEIYFDAYEFEEIVQNYLDHGKKSLAKKALNLGLKQHKDSTSLKLLKAELLVLENKLKRASMLLEQLNAIEPNNEEVYIQQASILSKQLQHQKAIEYLKYALSFEDEQEADDILSLIGMEYLHLNDYKNAITYFKKCVEVYPKDKHALAQIVYCYDALNEHKNAASYLKEYIDQKDPYSHMAWLQLGKQYVALESYENALNAFDYAVLINENSLAGFVEKAKTLEKLGRYKEAIENYKISFKIDTPTPYSLMKVGNCYEKMSMHMSALRYYKTAAHEDPLLDKAWIAIAEVYLKQDNSSNEALAAVTKALEIDPFNSYYWKQYAVASMNLNMFEETVAAFYKCIELKDQKIENYLNIFDALFIIGDYKQALSILLKAKDIYMLSAEIEYRLCGTYFMLNEKKSTVEALANALSIDFEKRYILNLLFPKFYNSSRVQKLIAEFEKGVG